MLGEPSLPAPVGVGSNDPHSVSLVRTPDVVSSKHTPSNIKPQPGKPFEHAVQSSSTKHRGVFGKDERRFALANDAAHFKPQRRAISVQASSSAGAADVLAGEAPADDVNVSAPGTAVEGADVIPDGEGVEHAITLPLCEHSLAVGFDLDGADSAPSEEMVAGKQSAAGPGK
jgi:hypothetical protein